MQFALISPGQGSELKEDVEAARIGESVFIEDESLVAEQVAKLVFARVHGITQIDREYSHVEIGKTTPLVR